MLAFDLPENDPVNKGITMQLQTSFVNPSFASMVVGTAYFEVDFQVLFFFFVVKLVYLLLVSDTDVLL